MKRILLLVAVLIQSVLVLGQTTGGPKNGPIISFIEKSHDFGDIKTGQKVEHIFKYKNTGTQPLVISDVVTTCQCTAKSWTKEPVQPGGTGEVSVTFDSAGKHGKLNKVITVISNAANSTEMIYIRVNVLPEQ